MSLDLNADDMTAVRARLGPRADELRRTMLDVDAPPIFLFSDDRARLVEARTRANEVLALWAAAEPEMIGEMQARLPELIRRRSAAESLLEALMWSDYLDLSIDLFNSPDPYSRVFSAAPHLLHLLDESGLIKVAGLDARPWGLHTGEYAFHYHQLLRRSYGSGIHYGLVGAVLRLAEQHDLTARFALDERRLRFKDEYQEIHEMDHWYGRALADEDVDILSVVGETFHGDPAGGASWLRPYAGLSVRWTADGPLKTVEIEEFMPPPTPGSDWVFARYLHAIRDTTKRAFIHCDGAVKAFAADSYPLAQHDFKHRGKGDRYRKVFRIDGEFPSSVWSEIACSWFRGNELVTEYFDRSTD